MGEAGRILNLMFSMCSESFQFEVTNILGCRPSKHNKRGEVVNRTPSQKEIENCTPRITELLEEITYDGIVYLGKTAASFVVRKGPPTLSLLHPSYILRQEYKVSILRQQANKLDNHVKDIIKQKQEDSDRG